MLNTLRRIVQEVNAAETLSAALNIMVKRVRKAMGTEVCSVYLLDPQSKRYHLMASQGLNQEAVGKVSLGASQGLVGLVGTREEPINLEDAPAHPRYFHLPETGEEQFNSFLGVPIVHQRRVLGVLVVQQKEKRKFDEGEEAFLVTTSAQLSGVIAHAEATGGLDTPGEDTQNQKPKKTKQFNGSPGCPGVAIGTVVVMGPAADLKSVPFKAAKDIDLELADFDKALEAVRADIRRVGEQLATELRPEEQALFDVYLNMLKDEALGNEVRNEIKNGQWAQGALTRVIKNYVRHFQQMEDPYLRERATDIKDLGVRILAFLQKAHKVNLEFEDDTVLVSEELTPAMLGEVPEGKLKALVSVMGSPNSHVSILARAMGIPTVMGAVDLPHNRIDGVKMIVDGYGGKVYINPTERMHEQFEKIVIEEQELVRDLETLKDLPSETTDGYRIPLWVNTGLIADAFRSLDRGAEGVGLYRTEVPFMMRERFPSEREQTDIYRQQLVAFDPNPVTMRTLDIGGDKALTYFPIEEENPFLGWRGIRVTLDHPEIFLLQVRAMIKASEGLSNLRIMLPMISSLTEVEEAQHLIYRAFEELKEDGKDIVKPQVGVMVEVPSLVFQIKELGEMVDFISVGSNDLTQYLLAVDRNNPRVSELYSGFHPGVIRSLNQIAEDAHSVGCKVSVCGELAGHPAGAVLLMAMGYDMLSMNAINLPRVKSVVRQIDMPWAKALLKRVLTMDNTSVIASTLELALNKAGLARLMKPQGPFEQ